MIRLSNEITKDSIVDGPGLRAVIWTQGCNHYCEGCHNPGTHQPDGGFLMKIDEVKETINNLRLHKGITFSGGEPFNQPKECLEIATKAKSQGLDIWCYTGYTFEELMNQSHKDYQFEWQEFLKVIDVLVDGPFMIEKKNLLLKFKGSENQRVIDVKESLRTKKIEIINEY